MKITLLLFILLSSLTTGFAQSKTFRWQSDWCDFRSTYDASKHSAAELRDTLKLIKTRGLLLEFHATPWEIKDIDTLDVKKLDAEYLAKKAELNNLKLVKLAYFEKLRSEILNDLEQYYQLSRVTTLAYKNPNLIKEFDSAPACRSKYADSLIAGGDKLLKKWLEVNIVSRSNNADPQRIKSIYEERLNSADKYLYAQNEVMTFGWWNCAVALLSNPQDGDRREKEFKKLFKKTKTIACDEP